MTLTIARHIAAAPDDRRVADDLAAELLEQIDRLEGSPARLEAAFDAALTHLQARCLIDPRAAEAETWESILSAMRLGSALFAVSGPRAHTTPDNWLTAFWLAVVCRDARRLIRLCEIPVDWLRSPTPDTDEFVFHWIEALQALLLGKPWATQLENAIALSYPEIATLAPRDLLQFLLYPPITLFHALTRRNAAEFNEALIDALQLHREYWAVSEDQANDLDGVLSLPVLGLACLAREADLPIEVESDYLPKHLLLGTWVDESDT
ncbi:immunity 49 family protein [Nocardia sp. NPDC003482]|uniref:immunity 49 family protein n=1 Tax=Nocardia sp. NPDC004068 TaxID=3364303 RepID=UPI003698E891